MGFKSMMSCLLVASFILAASAQVPQNPVAGRGWWDYARGPQVSCYRTADDFINELREQGSVVVHCPPGCLGMFEGNVYGSNPYWVHSSICPSAIHAGVITRDGGKVLLEWTGEMSNFARSIANGIMAWQRVTPGRAFSLRKWGVQMTPPPSEPTQSCIIEMNVQYAAQTFRTLHNSTSSDQCCVKCEADIECMAWTYEASSQTCLLKRRVGNRVVKKGAVSGLPVSVHSKLHSKVQSAASSSSSSSAAAKQMGRPVVSIDEGVTAPMTVFRKTQPRPDGVYPVSQRHFPRFPRRRFQRFPRRRFQRFPRRRFQRFQRFPRRRFARRSYSHRQPRRFMPRQRLQWRRNARQPIGAETNGRVQPPGPMNDKGNTGYHQLNGAGAVALPRHGALHRQRPYRRRPLPVQNVKPMRNIRKPTTVDIQGSTTGGVRVQGHSNAYLSRGADVNVRGQALVQVNSKSVVNAHQALAGGDSTVHVTQSKVNVHGRAHVQVHHDAPVFVAPNSYVSAAGRTHVNVGAGSQMRVHGRGTHVSVNPVN